MDLLENPFHILKATSRDNRRRIMELSEERSLLIDSDDCMQACSDLTNPMKRLSAEVAWLPGLGPKRAATALSLIENSVSDLLSMERLTAIARANLLAAGLSRLPSSTPHDVAEWILGLSWAFEDVDSEELCSVINEERIVSGFPEVTNLSMVEAEVQKRRHHYRHVAKSALNNLSAKELVEAATVAVETATDNGEQQGPVLIDDIVDSYEVEAQGFLESETENIETLVEKIRAGVADDQPDSTLAPMVNQLIQVVRNWDTVAQPIQVSTKSRGLDHDASHYIAALVRGLALHLFNEFGKIDFTEQLIGMLQEVFAEVVEVAERTAEDAYALDEIKLSHMSDTTEKDPSKIGDLTAGSAIFSDLPYEVQNQLIDRQNTNNQDQFRLKLDSITPSYIFIPILLCWFVFLYYIDAPGPKWKEETLWWYSGITLVVAILIGRNIEKIITWSTSKLKSYFYVTPLYYIKTVFDIVTFHPIWTLKDVKLTHNHKNGSYENSDVVLKFENHTVNLCISSKMEVDTMFQKMEKFDSQVRAEYEKNNVEYFTINNDFCGVLCSRTSLKKSPRKNKKIMVYALSVIICGISLFGSVFYNNQMYNKKWYKHGHDIPKTAVSIPDKVPKPSYPEKTLPHNGASKLFGNYDCEAPFEIKASGGSHYIVKLVDSINGKPVMNIFVRNGHTVTTEVPLGAYEIRYACGIKWYGNEYLFGPDTRYSKAEEVFDFKIIGNQVRGYTITLYAVADGNLRTSSISAADF